MDVEFLRVGQVRRVCYAFVVVLKDFCYLLGRMLLGIGVVMIKKMLGGLLERMTIFRAKQDHDSNTPATE